MTAAPIPWNCTTWRLIPGCESEKARGEPDGLLDGLELATFTILQRQN